jgi:hypothetical protein
MEVDIPTVMRSISSRTILPMRRTSLGPASEKLPEVTSDILDENDGFSGRRGEGCIGKPCPRELQGRRREVPFKTTA